MRFNSIRFKTTVLYTLILAAILTIFGASILYVFRMILYRDINERLIIRAEEVEGIIQSYRTAQSPEHIPSAVFQRMLDREQRIEDEIIIDDLWHSFVKTLNLKNDYIRILTLAGDTALISDNINEEEEKFFDKEFPVTIDGIVFLNLKYNNVYLRAVNYPVYIDNAPRLIVQIATPVLDRLLRVMNKLMVFIIFSIILILALTVFLGGVLAKSILVPVKEIAETANTITHKRLKDRVDEKYTDAEIQYLVNSFNTMLNRLEESFEHIQEFSSHVAHELKTPLAILRGELELALHEKRTEEELRKVLETGMEEVNQVIKIVKDLLLLANLGYRRDIFKFEKINFVDFIKEICENGKILAKEKKIEMTADISPEESCVEGDKVHLRRLFFNLIHNAIKFTPAGGKIRIVFKEQDQKAVISVADTGTGIAKKDLDKVFTKFFHAAPQAQNAEPGSGLGLSIAQAIAKAHGGEISVESEIDKGSIFTVTLPLTS